MSALDMLNTTPAASATSPAAVRPVDAPPDDPDGAASRAFAALLDAFTEPAAPTAPATALPSAAPGPVAPAMTVLRQALQAKPGAAAGAESPIAADLGTQAADAAATDGKTSTTSDDIALTDIIKEPDAAATTLRDAAPPQSVSPLWSAAVDGAVAPMLQAAAAPQAMAEPVPPRPTSVPLRGEPPQSAAAKTPDGLADDVGRLFDAAAGATEAVLSKGSVAPSRDVVLNTSVTVLRTETHLPPVTPTTPLHQIMAAITGPDGLAAGSADPSATPANDPAAAAAPERQLVRTLDIRLEPPDLGSVTVKLRLSGQHLALNISTDTASTAHSLEQDRDTLATLLRGNGYTTEIGAVRHEPGAAVIAAGLDASAPSQSSAGQSSAQGSGQGSGGGSADGGARPQGGQAGGQQQQRENAGGFRPGEQHDADVADAASGGGVYL
jgi:chemotaxis protein MotD